MEKIATDISSFENLRKGGYVYVDKTDLLWRLACDREGRQFFISRPRRFGKSLMLSTFKCLFEGRRDLFKGLKIERKRWDWQKTWPVVMLDMSKAKASDIGDLEEVLKGQVRSLAREFGVVVDKADFVTSARAFGTFLDGMAASRGEFVVLVDEYDVPLQGFLSRRADIRKARSLLHDFYVQLKAHSGDFRFLMLTGVTKLTKLSVFSGLNHLTDLTMKKPEYAALLGYRRQEILDNFPRRLGKMARVNKTDVSGAMKLLTAWYDSYRFAPYSAAKVFNPISVGMALGDGILEGYWAGTGMATRVMERMEAARKSPADFEGCTATVSELDLCDALELPAKSLMYQSGYLTIKGLSKTEVDEIGNPKLILGAPNHEVRGALKAGWFDHFVKIPSTEFEALVDVAKRQVSDGNLDGLVTETLYRVYAKVPPEWRIRSEADAKRHFRLFMEMLGAEVSAEAGSARGYADAIIATKKFVWVFEFKFNKTSQAAIRQIREKGYADSYRGDGRPVTLVGVNFRKAKRNIDEPLFEPL